MFSYWTESTVVVTKDKFMHVYPFKDLLAVQNLLQNNNGSNETEKDLMNDAVGGQGAGGGDKKKKSGGKLELDWSRPYMSINLSNLKTVE